MTTLACATPASNPSPAPSAAAPLRIARPEPSGNVGIRCTPEDAEVIVDGESFGTALQWSGAQRLNLQPGPHRLELRRTGYKTYRTEIAVGEVVEVIEVRLEKAPE